MSLMASHIVFSRARQIILDGIDFLIQASEVTALLGANGAGKSSLMRLMCGDQIGSYQGELSLNKVALETLSAKQKAQQRVVLPQKPSLNFALSVHDVVTMGTYPFDTLSPLQVSDLTQRALALADVLHLEHRSYEQLSGGEQQRIQFARTVVQVLGACQVNQASSFFLLDEPTSSLDPLHQTNLLCALRDLALQERIGICVILHEVNLAARWCDRIAFLHQGKIIACDTPAKVISPEILFQVYGTNAHVMPHPLYSDKVAVLWE